MEKGDLILTPSLLWHDHGHEGEGPVVLLDALDLPLVYGLEASYAIEAPPQQVTRPAGHSTRRYRQGGVIPYAALGRQRAPYPLLRFPWKDVRQTLDAFSALTPRNERVHVAYVNPETGRECLVDDAPLQRALGFYEESGATGHDRRDAPGSGASCLRDMGRQIPACLCRRHEKEPSSHPSAACSRQGE
jgi:gentisate 1,2-dioxygenase